MNEGRCPMMYNIRVFSCMCVFTVIANLEFRRKNIEEYGTVK